MRIRIYLKKREPNKNSKTKKYYKIKNRWF